LYEEVRRDLIMCMYCKCKEVTPSITTHVVNYKGCIIVIKNVPCEECEQCGEKFYSDEVARHLEKIVNIAKNLMQEISVIDYAKSA
jgi:YgiT-type zinc finger domain-containing protein